MPRTLGSQPYMPVLPSNNQQALSSGDVYYELGPNYSNQERLVTQALQVAAIPGDQILAAVPTLWFVDVWPQRYGYESYQQRQADISTVLDVDRAYRNRRSDLSGGVAGWQGAARNVGTHDVF